MAGKNEQNKKNIHDGHRARMRERFAADERLEGFAEHEIMEMLLFFVIPRGDTNAAAHELISQFGSVRGVVNAPLDRLRQVRSIGENAAVMLKLLGSISDYIAKQRHEKIDVRDMENFPEYIKSLFLQETAECFRVLCITESMGVSTVSVVSRGSESSTEVNFRELARIVLNSGSRNIILAHNHPDSPSAPSQEDIILTRKIMQYLAPFDITVIDHFIVGKDSVLSMRRCGFIHDMEC